MDTPEQKKRRRLESESQDDGENSQNPPASKTQLPVRSKRIWFDDGNVVLQVENTQFKVHKSVLALHSNVLRDMFALPQPSNEECPVVLHHDSCVDWDRVLGIFYDGLRCV